MSQKTFRGRLETDSTVFKTELYIPDSGFLRQGLVWPVLSVTTHLLHQCTNYHNGSTPMIFTHVRGLSVTG